MANCIMCETKIGFMNKPTFGNGKLLDNTEICSSCFLKINKIDPFLLKKLKNMTSDDLKNILLDKEANKETEKKAKETDNQRLNEIKEQIKNLNLDNVSTFLGRKEVNELPNILFANESVLDIVQGTYSNNNGILVATESRLIFIDKGLIYGLKVEDFPYDKITSIQYETGLILGKIIIMASGNRAEIDNVNKVRVKPFSDFTRTQISNHGKSNSTQNVTINQPIDLADQLSKLASLRDKGILTDEEFQIQKSRLLS